jgi:hypothetical protein
VREPRLRRRSPVHQCRHLVVTRALLRPRELLARHELGEIDEIFEMVGTGVTFLAERDDAPELRKTLRVKLTGGTDFELRDERFQRLF